MIETSSSYSGACPQPQPPSASDLCLAIRRAALALVPDHLRGSVAWFGMQIPAVSNPAIFVQAGLLPATSADALLARFDHPTALDAAAGDSRLAAQSIRVEISSSGCEVLDIDAHQVIADRELAAFDQAPGTRTANWRLWCAVITWAIVHGCADRILPMSDATLRSLTMELIALDCSGQYILSVVQAVQDRHRRLGLTPPHGDRLQFGKLMRGVLKVSGSPRALRFPIQRSHVVSLLRQPRASLREARDFRSSFLWH